MDNSCLKNLLLIQNEFLLCIVMLTLLPISFKPALALGLGNETDKLALLALKDQLVSGSSRALNSWNDSLHFCDWEGVKCGRRHQRVSTLNLTGLELAGIISPFVANLTFLREVSFSYNKLKGNIPMEFGHLRRLLYLDLSHNNLQGQLPIELTNCSNLQMLMLHHNKLVGKIPFNLGGMKNLSILSLHYNNLSGTIPSFFGNLSSLNYLALSSNYFEGVIPSALGRLSNLKKLGLSVNKLSGTIPSSIYNLSFITILSLSINQLFGRLAPELGNAFPKLELFYAGGSQFVGMITTSISNISSLQEFDIAQNNFFGSVPNNLGNLKNLQGNDFKALVFEFMPNGSLEGWLHEQHGSRYLNLTQRLDIAVDVANAIDYLHHNCETLIVHCDLKPTNVLLNDDMVAHVGDFGLAKLLSIETNNIGSDQTSSSMIKGTIGYIPPEYGIGGTVSPEGDIYSYGIMLLELITGRRPTDDLFHDGLSLHNFCKMALPECLEEILDFHLLEEISEHRQRLRSRPKKEGEIWECLVSFTKIGIACSLEASGDRMKIKDAIVELHATKARLLRTGVYMGDRR
ncbi:hypothetical protein DITRI_Ditri09bG0148800 [Diplodiscus trichospermus]